MPKVKRRYRDAENGQFTTKEDAEERPKETVSEKIEKKETEDVFTEDGIEIPS